MRVVVPEEDGETEPEVNPQHEGGDADRQEIEHRPDLTDLGDDEGTTTTDDRGPYTGGRIEGSLHQVLDREMVHGDGGDGPEGVTPWASIALSFTSLDGQEVRLELDQNVGAEDFEAGLEAFERTVKYVVGAEAVRRET